MKRSIAITVIIEAAITFILFLQNNAVTTNISSLNLAFTINMTSTNAKNLFNYSPKPDSKV